MKQQQSREITDELRAITEPLIPPKEREADLEYWRKAGGGRHPVAPRTALAGIFSYSVPASPKL